MARDVKLIQRGVNVQANDLAVPPGTPVRAFNVDFQRDGVAQRRAGFANFFDGLPPYPLDPSFPVDPNFAQIANNARLFELFARDRAFMISGGFPYTYDESRDKWITTPIDQPHRITFFGDTHFSGWAAGFARAVAFAANSDAHGITPLRTQFEWTEYLLLGTPGNRTSEARLSPDPVRFYQPFDVAGNAISDYNTIRSLTNGGLIAGSLTVTGSTNGTGDAATFLNASWMAFDGTSYYVVDNTNQIRKVTGAGVVTTFAGSTTSGFTNATGTAARFNDIRGICYDAGNLYVADFGNSAIRKIVISTGVVTTHVSGITNGPSGIEAIQSYLYFCGKSSTGGRVQRVAITSPGAPATYAGFSPATGTISAMVGGRRSQADATGCLLPFSTATPVLRGKYTPGGLPDGGFVTDGSFLIVETQSGANMDVGLLWASDTASAEECLHHIYRCPSAYPDGNSQNKMDTLGPAMLANTDPRMIDLGSGIAANTSQRPIVMDAFQERDLDDPMPRFRAMGIMAPEAPVVSSVAGTTFASSMTVAYRVVCGMTLTDGKIAFGPPSERIVLAGSVTATWSGSITAYPPPGLPYDGLPFMQLYRTRVASITQDPGDQMFLCYETALAYGAAVQITDQLPDDLLGAELYTNTSADGVAATALPPPTFVGDIAAFGLQAVLGNVINPASIRIKVLGTSALSAGSSTLTLTINSEHDNFDNGQADVVTLTAISGATAPASNEFQIASGGTAAENAVQTARNIVSVINRSPDCYWLVAQYDEGDPGTIIITSLWPGTSRLKNPLVGTTGNEFTPGDTIQASNQGSITPSTNAATAFAFVSNNVSQREPATIRYSEQSAFDSFPVGNAQTIGNGGESIVRLLPIAETLLAVKDDVVWRMDQQFDPLIYDNALSCTMPNSFAMLNNQWIGLFTRGFVALSTSQGLAIGRPIDRDVVAQYSKFSSALDSGHPRGDFAFAAAVNLTSNYLCSFNRRCYCYNAASQSWSEWAINSLVDQDDGESGIIGVGSYTDSFIVTQNTQRGVLRQRRYQRDDSDYYKDFSDQAYDFGSGTLSAALQTIAFSAYDASPNAGTLAPKIWDPPAGAIESAGNTAAEFHWVFEVTQDDVTEHAFGVLVVASVTNPTTAFSVTLSQPLSSITAGTVTVVGYSPIIVRVQYAPFASPGSNAGFGDMLATVERSQPGYLIARFFNRQDYGDATEQAVGWYTNDFGVSRARLMSSITSQDNGVSHLITYQDPQRLPVPSQRATGQTLGIELWHGVAWDPLAIKSVAQDKRPTDNAKVTE